MNAPNLSRRIASSIVDGLKARGRILVVKGGTAALVRAVDQSMASELERLSPTGRATPPTPHNGEAAVALEAMVEHVVGALLKSEHLEDVFAERSVVHREVEDAVRTALSAAREEAEEATVHVRLDLLGYVAATAGKRAPAGTLREALERAGHLAGARLADYDADTRTATFIPEAGGDPDLRLELEEAVADELSALVETGQVDLPTLERTVHLDQDVSSDLRPVLRRRIEALVTRTLRRTGCATSWDFEGARALRVTFTPMSEGDARAVDTHLAQFAREANAALAELPPRPPEPRMPPMPAPKPRVAEPKPEVEELIPPTMQTPVMPANGWGAESVAVTSEVVAAPSEEPPAPRTRATTKKRTTRSSTRPPPAPRPAAKRTPTKRAAKRTTATAEEPARKKAAASAKRTVTATPKPRKAPAKKRSS